MRCKRGTGGLAETGDNVDDTWWEAGLLDKSGSNEGAEWGLFSGLDDNSVTASDGWANLPCPHEQWEVPWDDLSAHTNGLALDVVEGIGGGVHDLALDLVCPAAVVSQAAGAHADVDLGHVDGLAVVEGLNRGEELDVLLEEICERDKVLATVLWSLLPPWALECLAGCRYGNVDVLLCGLVDLASHALVRWVDDIELLALNTFHELVVDEPDAQSVSLATHHCD